MSRYAFYAVNGLGLGHLTRLIAIARALRRQERDAEILFVTSSEADGVAYQEGFAAVKVPSKTIREQTGLKKTTYLKMAQSVVWNTLSAFDPDVLVVDTFPTGSFEELLPVLRWRQKNVFVFREQRPDSAEAEILQASLKLYDRVIVPHELVDAVGPLPEPDKALAVGPVLVRERSELFTRAEARSRLGLPATGSVLYASFGGGGDPDGNRALSLVAEVARSRPGLTLAVGAGPLARGTPDLPGAAILAGRFPMLECLAAFDAAVTAAGYNTVAELLFAGIPSALVPFPRVLDDQSRRAAELARNGAAVCVAPLSRESLGKALDAILGPEAPRMAKAAQKQVAKNGAERAAKAIRELG